MADRKDQGKGAAGEMKKTPTLACIVLAAAFPTALLLWDASGNYQNKATVDTTPLRSSDDYGRTAIRNAAYIPVPQGGQCLSVVPGETKAVVAEGAAYGHLKRGVRIAVPGLRNEYPAVHETPVGQVPVYRVTSCDGLHSDASSLSPVFRSRSDAVKADAGNREVILNNVEQAFQKNPYFTRVSIR